jgi:hypothetical protein
MEMCGYVRAPSAFPLGMYSPYALNRGVLGQQSCYGRGPPPPRAAKNRTQAFRSTVCHFLVVV